MPRRWSGLARVAVAGVAGGLLACAGHAAAAQEPPLTAIRAGRLVDVERGEVRRDQVVLVRGYRITAIQPGP